MYDDLKDRRALITGGAQGIGEAIARRLAQEGCDLVLVARNEAKLQAVKAEIERDSGRRVEVVSLDMGAKDSAGQLAHAYPDIDVLVNNAGEDPSGLLDEIDEEAWQRAWDVKGFGYVNMCRKFYPLMRERGSGVIINILGIAHYVKEPKYILGAASIGALATFTQTLGGASMHDGVRVLGVCPGITATPRMHKAKKIVAEVRARAGAAGAADEELDIATLANAVAQGNGLARAADPREIAAVVAFAASAEASYMSGVTINVDGGLSRS